MQRRLWLSSATLATGAALLVAAQFAGATPDRRGRILRYQSAYQDWSIPNLALK